MYCTNCGAPLPGSVDLCPGCGTHTEIVPDASLHQNIGCIGYSNRINDPAFAGYIKNSNLWSAIFSMILAVAAIIGFYIYGEVSSEMENPQSFYIGIGIGGMFMFIALLQIIWRKKIRTWDGVVVDKTIKKKKHRQSTGISNDDCSIHYYTEYAVIVRENESGKTHRMVAEDDKTVFDYYNVGDLVRRHAGLNSYEKYDKSKDSIIFCSACSTLCDIKDDCCWRCNCPLLK